MRTLNTCTSSTRPGSPAAGDTLFETDTNKIIVYDGSEFKEYKSDSGTYDLDGTNTLSVRPLFHFDAEKINGSDATGNPSNAAAFTGQWISKVNSATTVAQATASAQPTYNTSGENSQAYLSFDGGDFLHLTTRVYFKEDFTFMTIAKGAASTSNMSPLGGPGADFDPYASNAFNLGGAGPFSGRPNDVLIFYSDNTVSGYPGTASFPTGKNFHAQTRNLIFKRESAAATLFFDGNNQVSRSSNTSNVDIRVGSIGKTNFNKTTGNIYEIIAFDSALSSTDLNSWNAYVTSRYAAGSGAMESQDNF